MATITGLWIIGFVLGGTAMGHLVAGFVYPPLADALLLRAIALGVLSVAVFLADMSRSYRGQSG